MKISHIKNERITRARQGDEVAMKGLYNDYSAMVLNTAYRIVNNRPEAEDVLQDTFINAFSRLSQFDERASFGSWVKRIAVNRSIDLLRRRTPRTFEMNGTVEDKDYYEPEFNSLDTEEPIEYEGRLEEIYAAIHQLPDGYRSIFSMYVLEGYDHEEIAKILDIKVSTSISQLSRAKKKIRQLIPKIVKEKNEVHE